jgi:hypothetical protein
MFYRSGLARATEFYMPDTGRGPRNPLISPPYADLRGPPPLLIHVGADETLRDDSTELAQLFHPFLPKGPVARRGFHISEKGWPGSESIGSSLSALLTSADNVGHREETNTRPAGLRIKKDDPVTPIYLACGRKIDADLGGPLTCFPHQFRRRSGAELQVLT